jgi:diguanylate cyclase (GGDEF)-like protein/PAS domain S-box-containing protein
VTVIRGRAALIARHGLVTLLFLLSYFLLNRPEVILLSRMGFVVWYPASGLVIALMLGISPWYALLCCVADSLASRLIYAQPINSYTNTIGSLGVSFSYGLAAYVLRGPLRIDLGLRRRRDVVRYVGVGTVAVAGATLVGVSCLVADHSIALSEYKSSAVGWFLGDAIGLIGIAPFLLVHIFPRVRLWLADRRDQPDFAPPRTQGAPILHLIEGSAQAIAILAVLWIMFGSEKGRYDHFYLSFIPIIWIAMRQGIRRVVIGLLTLNFGIVVAMHLFPPTVALFNNVALLMMVSSAVGLIVGSEVSERERLAVNLTQQTTYLNSLIQNSPLGIVVLDRQGKVELANPAFEDLSRYRHTELSTFNLMTWKPKQGEPGDSEQLISRVFSGEALHLTVQLCRKDGQVRDAALHGVPLLLNDVVRGAYLIYEDVSDQIKTAEAQRLHAESLDRLVKELELRTQQMSALSEMGLLLECSNTVVEASSVVSTSVRKLFPDAISGALYVFKSSRNLVEAAVQWGEETLSETVFYPESCWSLRRGQPHWSGQHEPGLSCNHLAINTKTECLCLPLVAQGNTIGVLHFQFEGELEAKHQSAGRDGRERLAISAASQIALSLASLQMRETLREQSIRDPLTRLYNRRFLEEALERELELASRKKQSVAILFLDLDHFKQFNDMFGHDAGDMVLLALADLFRSFFRTTDICCRYGGEEFAILLPESSAKDAAIRADRLRSEVHNLQLQYKKETVGRLTVSIGVAAFPEHCSNSLDLLKVADECLYKSKSRGRDAVTVAQAKKAL